MKHHLRIFFLSLMSALLILEVLGRVFRPEVLVDFTAGSEETLGYEFDAELGWFPKPHDSRFVKAARRVEVKTNGFGFRDEEWPARGDRRRVLFLGDSFVWGSDVEAGERFQAAVAATRPDLDVMSMGVAGFGNDQELLMLRRFFRRADPDIVFLVYVGLNDPENNATNFFYGNYKPYFIRSGAGRHLELQGIPVPRSIAYTLKNFVFPFRYSIVARGAASVAIESFQGGKVVVPDVTADLISEIRDFTERKGRRFMVGYESISKELLEELRSRGMRPVSLVTEERYQSHATHWTPAGHQTVARAVLDSLRDADAPHL